MTALTRQPDAPLAPVLDLAAHRDRRRRAAADESAWSTRAILYITPEFVAAMQGVWGDLPTFVPHQVRVSG